MLVAAASSSPKALWYLTRGTGIVALILLTITMALGLAQVGQLVRPGLPRLLVSALHRNSSLLAVGLLCVHISTAIADSYAPIHLVDVVVPFASAYRPIWVGFGALAFDVLLVLIATSLIRQHLGVRAWKTIHWSAYACWPLAVIHGLGTGTDPRLRWVEAIYVVCTATVVAALWWRVVTTWSPSQARQRLAVVGSSVVLVVVVAAWSLAGPLRPGWAHRSESPRSLIGVAASRSSTKGLR
jgi:predicted ferric reductase